MRPDMVSMRSQSAPPLRGPTGGVRSVAYRQLELSTTRGVSCERRPLQGARVREERLDLSSARNAMRDRGRCLQRRVAPPCAVPPAHTRGRRGDANGWGGGGLT